jgi:hypothetical protein
MKPYREQRGGNANPGAKHQNPPILFLFIE